MNRSRSCLLALSLAVAALVTVPGAVETSSLAQAPAAPATLDQIDFNKASDLADQGEFAEAAKLFAGIPLNYPVSPVIPQATLKLGYVYFRLNDFDRAVENLKKVPNLKNAPPEVSELALSLVPQVLSAKAASLPANAPARKAAFEEAVKQFDLFLQKFPASDEAESGYYGKAVALYQLARYDDAGTALKTNLQKFSNSETVLDSQFLLALTMATQANGAAQKSDGKDPAADTTYDNAGKMLTDVIRKGSVADVSIANDARMQVGEVEFSHAGFLKDEKLRDAMLLRALDAFRQVLPKEIVIQAEKARIEAIKQRRQQAISASHDLVAYRRLGRVVDKEMEKLAAVEARPDQTLSAKIKMGQIFLQLGRSDEARVVLSFAQQFSEDADQKKQIAYYTALSLAAQNMRQHAANQVLADKTLAAYAEFRTAHKADPIAENLALVVGAGFVEHKPEKAIELFRECASDYPHGKSLMTALAQEAAALTQLGQFDEALKAYKDTLAQKPDREVAAMAEFGIALINQKTGKVDEAIAAFKNVRDKYTGLAQAEQAAFWHAQLTLEKGDSKTALAELEAFLKNFPKSSLVPNAEFYLAQAETAQGKKDKALMTYKELGDKFPQSEVAPFSYFARAQLYRDLDKMDRMLAVYQDFIKAFPDSPQAFQAYDAVAQISTNQGNEALAISTYEDFVKTHAADPNAPQALLRVSESLRKAGDKTGRYSLLNEEQRKQWAENVEGSIKASERVVQEYPASPQVALALQNILECENQREAAKQVTDADIEKYFGDLAEKFKDKPATRSKVLFTLAAHLYEKDKVKAVGLMASAYDPAQKYAPADLDLYGTALIEQKKLEDAAKVYEKLATDYAVPKGVEPTKASREVQEAQAMSLFGEGKVLEIQKNAVDSKKKYDELERLYPWSPKMAEASYGIAASLYNEKKFDDITKRLKPIINSRTASAELRAKGMLLLGRVQEDLGEYEAAVGNYTKIANFYDGVPAVASEGLWRGASLLELEGNGKIPMPTPVPIAAKPSASPAKAVAKK